MHIRNLFYTGAILASCLINASGQDYNRGNVVQQYIDRKMSEEPFSSGIVGIMAMSIGGDTIALYNPTGKLLPASNTKLITTGLALNGLTPNYKFETKIGYSGHVHEGTLHGDLYIIGGGDPTLASGDNIAMQTDSLFSIWASSLRKSGIHRIDGDIVGDGRFFDGPIENESWSYNDLGTWYGAGSNALCYGRNIQTITVSPGTHIGDNVDIMNHWPEAPWIKFNNRSITSPSGTGDNLYLFNTDLAPVSELRGSLGIDKGVRKEKCSNKFGALTCAWSFANFLEMNGFRLKGNAADIDSDGNVRKLEYSEKDEYARLVGVKQAEISSNLEIICKTFSPDIGRIAKTTNSRSDNLYAETLLRILSKIRTGSASYDSCRVTVLRETALLGLDPGNSLRMVDGSGLSRLNYISPEYFCRFLKAMTLTPYSDDYMNTIGHPGEGTMKYRLTGLKNEDRQRIYMKSGSMDGVQCFSGYIRTKTGKPEDMIVFSIMTNNIPDSSDKVLPFIDRLISLIYFSLQ